MNTQTQSPKSALTLILAAAIAVTACGKGAKTEGTDRGSLDQLNPEASLDDAVVRARAYFTVDTEQEFAALKLLNRLLVPSAFAATGTSTVTYVNAESTSFSINVTAFGPTGFQGNTLNLGSIALAGLSDNKLKVCGVSGNQKCTKAIIRVYTTGSADGFVHTDDGYGMPVYAGSLNPTTAVGREIAGSVEVQTVTIAGPKNKLTISDFPTPTYSVTSDFSNAGAGSYSMNFVVEYALSL